MITTLITVLRERLEKRRRYHAVLAEIASLDHRDLRDLRADPSEMKWIAYQSIYGAPR